MARARWRVGYRARRGARRVLRLLPLIAPTLWIVASDLYRRAEDIVALKIHYRVGYAMTALASVVFWSVLVAGAAHNRQSVRRVFQLLFVTLFTLVVGIQAGFHERLNLYLCVDSQASTRSIMAALTGGLPFSRAHLWLHLGGALLLALVVVAAARLWLRPSHWLTRFAPFLLPLALAGAAVIPTSYRKIQASTYDALYFHGLSYMAQVRLNIGNHPKRDVWRLQQRHPERVGHITARPERPRNVLFLLEESVRFDMVCSEYTPRCRAPARHHNRWTKDRIPLLQMRSHTSATAISMGVLLSGTLPTASAFVHHRAPYIFQYAHAAGYDTAYWTAQNVMVSGARFFTLDQPLTHYAYATTVRSAASVDYGISSNELVLHVLSRWNQLKEPFFAVVHFASAHSPYYTEKRHSPYRRNDGSPIPARYRNAIHLSDMAVAKLIRRVRKTPAGARTVIIYTSDHGESFGENGNRGHTASVAETELRVPAWIDAPKGTISPVEEQSLRSVKRAYTTQIDLSATMMDLLGVWDAAAFAPFRKRMHGQPLTRPGFKAVPMPITNCNFVWGCGPGGGNWGIIHGPKKIWSKFRDGTRKFRCYNLTDDPLETNRLDPSHCAPLPALADKLFGGPPRSQKKWPPDPGPY